MRDQKEKNGCSGEKRGSLLSAVRKEEKLDIRRPNEMIQREPEEKCVERHKGELLGKKDKMCAMRMTPYRAKKHSKQKHCSNEKRMQAAARCCTTSRKREVTKDEVVKLDKLGAFLLIDAGCLKRWGSWLAAEEDSRPLSLLEFSVQQTDSGEGRKR